MCQTSTAENAQNMFALNVSQPGAPAMERTLPAHPNSARLMPSSSPIGLMNNPRFSEANAWPMALAAVSTATMTQP